MSDATVDYPKSPPPLALLRERLFYGSARMGGLLGSVPATDLVRLKHVQGCFDAWVEYLDICQYAASNLREHFRVNFHSGSQGDAVRDVEPVLSQLLTNIENQDFSTRTKALVADSDAQLLRYVGVYAGQITALLNQEDVLKLPHEVLENVKTAQRRLDALTETARWRIEQSDRVWASVAAEEDARRAKESAAEAQHAVEVSRQAAGLAGDVELSTFYAKLAKEEKGAANNFRRLTVIMSFAAAASAALFVMGPSVGLEFLAIGMTDYVHLIQRGVLVAGVFGLAGYFARQAHQHRSMANWASALSVQLRTFDAYLKAIDNHDVKDDLRKSFGARVFGDHPAMKGEPPASPSAASVDAAVGLATKLAGGGK